MITDPIFYRLFATSPETFFQVLGLSIDAARQMAARYQYEAVEFKETAHRLDGVFRPKEPGLPLYFLEVQFYRLPSVFADLLVKAYSYLKRNDPAQSFCGVVLFGRRSLEPQELAPYRPLLDAGVIQRYYLDEMPEVPDAPLGLSIIYLIRQAESQTPACARQLVARTRTEIHQEALRHDLVELIETIVLYKLPRLSREEIQTMLQVHDIRETRVYQEALAEGKAEGKAEGIAQEQQRQLQEKWQAVAKLAALQVSAEDIAAILGLDVQRVRQEIARTQA